MSDIEIAATGSGFLGENLRAIEPLTEELIRNSRDEIQVIAYLMSREAVKIAKLIEKAASDGLKVTIVLNSFDSVDGEVLKIVTGMARRFKHARVLSFEKTGKQLHAKVIVSDRKKAIVSSANLSFGGMFANYELGLLVEGETAWKLGRIVDKLVHMSSK